MNKRYCNDMLVTEQLEKHFTNFKILSHADFTFKDAVKKADLIVTDDSTLINNQKIIKINKIFQTSDFKLLQTFLELK